MDAGAYLLLFCQMVGTISLQKKIDLQESFLNFNNEIVLSAASDISHQNISSCSPNACTIQIARFALPVTSMNVKAAANAI
jgi:hypothetical protein